MNVSANPLPADPEHILTRWLISITAFRSYYRQIATYINQSEIEQDLTLGNTAYLSQCSISLLVGLLTRMDKELKKLAQDIDQFAKLRPSGIAQHYKQLATHTRVLNQLNQQAQNRLYLVNQSCS